MQSVKDWRARQAGKLGKGKSDAFKALEIEAKKAEKEYLKHNAIHKKAYDAVAPLRKAAYQVKEDQRRSSIKKAGQANPGAYAKNQTAIRAKIKTLSEKFDALQKKHDELDKQYDKIRKYDTGLSRDVENNKLDSLNNRKETLEIKMDDIENEIYELEQKLGHD